jgi:hypothetical protein
MNILLVVAALCGENTMTVLPIVVVKSRKPYTVWVTEGTFSITLTLSSVVISSARQKLRRNTETKRRKNSRSYEEEEQRKF